MNLLPADTNFRIGSYCSLASLNVYSRTCKDVRNSCGMLKLNELYACALQEFLKLQGRLVLRCKYSEIPKSVQNVLTVQLKDYKPEIKAKASLEIKPHSVKQFEAAVGVMVEKNEYFVLEDIGDILPDLKEDQFFIAVRLGNHKGSDVEIPERHLNSATTDFVRTVTYPIKDIVCIFNSPLTISENAENIVRKALKKANPSLFPSSSFTYSLSSFM